MSALFRRTELLEGYLELGAGVLDLADYATTGLRALAIGPSGIGKTNAGLVIAEQLADQGWVNVLIDPEGELESLYGTAVADADDLAARLRSRKQKFLVVSAKDASEFVPFGRAILEVADECRKPVLVVMDEGQVFSAAKKRKGDIAEATDIVNEFAERGRKRALDLFMTAHRFTGTLHRSIFANKNLSFVGRQEDPTAWAALAPSFRASRIDFNDLAALEPGQFFCFSRRGVERVRIPMAKALQDVAPKATVVKPTLPSTYSQWDRAMREIPTLRLKALTPPVRALLASVAGLDAQQLRSGERALEDELACR